MRTYVFFALYHNLITQHSLGTNRQRTSSDNFFFFFFVFPSKQRTKLFTRHQAKCARMQCKKCDNAQGDARDVASTWHPNRVSWRLIVTTTIEVLELDRRYGKSTERDTQNPRCWVPLSESRALRTAPYRRVLLPANCRSDKEQNRQTVPRGKQPRPDGGRLA